MRALGLLPYYLTWHYSNALVRGVYVYRNFIWFVWHFFSMGVLLGTLFQPWERMHDEPEHSFTFSSIFAAWTLNAVYRGVGFIVRAAFIFVGLFMMATFTTAACVVLIAWLAFPLCLLAFFFTGLVFLVR